MIFIFAKVFRHVFAFLMGFKNIFLLLLAFTYFINTDFYNEF